jgi:hypothetical protein
MKGEEWRRRSVEFVVGEAARFADEQKWRAGLLNDVQPTSGTVQTGKIAFRALARGVSASCATLRAPAQRVANLREV